MKIIAIEGLDKAGKHTAQTQIYEYLIEKGYKVELMSFPRYNTPIGKLIWNWLHHDLDVNHQTFELLQAADKTAALDILKQYEKDDVDFVVIDRYVASSLAYGRVDNDSEWIDSLIQHVIFPDITFYLDVAPEVSMSRKGEHGENDKYESDFKRLKVVSQYYQSVFDRYDYGKVINIDANQSLENVRDQLNIVLKNEF